jgi:hypothetical protein
MGKEEDKVMKLIKKFKNDITVSPNNFLSL